MPLVFFISLRGIKIAHDNGFMIIICMCFVCLFILNKIILKDEITKNNIIAFILSYPSIIEDLIN